MFLFEAYLMVSEIHSAVYFVVAVPLPQESDEPTVCAITLRICHCCTLRRKNLETKCNVKIYGYLQIFIIGDLIRLNETETKSHGVRVHGYEHSCPELRQSPTQCESSLCRRTSYTKPIDHMVGNFYRYQKSISNKSDTKTTVEHVEG